MIRRVLAFSVMLGLIVLGTGVEWRSVEAAINDTVLASRNTADAQAAGESDSPAMSADGRYIAFASAANSLDAAAVDVNGAANIYRRDLTNGDTILIDRIIASNTAASGGSSGKPTISADGNCVAFTSSHTGSTMVSGAVASFNVFVRNVGAGTTQLANRASGAAGTPSSGSAFEGFLNADCTLAVFNCNSCNALTPGTNGSLNNEVYMRQLVAPFVTERVSVRDGFTDTLAATPNSTSGNPTISADGRYVAFLSQATNIEAGVATAGQVYVRDRVALTTKAVSRNTVGTVGSDGSHANPMISADGRFITWDTNSEIVVPNTAVVDKALTLSVQGPVAGGTPVPTGPSSGTCFNGIQCFLYANSISTPNASTWTCPAGCAGAGGLTTDTGMQVFGQNGHGWIFGTPNLSPGVLPKSYVLTLQANNGTNGNIPYTVNIVAPPANGPAFAVGMGTSYTYTQGQDGSFVVNGFPSDVVISCGPAGNPTFATLAGTNCGGALPAGVTNSPTGSCGTACNIQISGNPIGAAVGSYPVTYRARLRNQNTVIRNLSGVAANGMAANETRRVNKINGTTTDSAFPSNYPSISADGRFVAFTASATDLVAGASLTSHVYLRDIAANSTELVDRSHTGTTQSNNGSYTLTIGSGGDPIPFSHASTLVSTDGRFVAFASDGNNLVSPDAGGFRDVFRRQRLANGGTTIGIVRGATWYLNNQLDGSAQEFTVNYGIASDIPIAGDWDCSGTSTPGIFRNGAFYLSNNKLGTVSTSFFFGGAGDVPIVGDWDGNGCDSVGIFRNGWFFMTNAVSGSPVVNYSFFYGATGDIPVAGDWDGNGSDSVGVYRAGNFYLTNAISGSPVPNFSFGFGGLGGDIPVTGDWDGNNAFSVGIFRSGSWYLTNAISGSPLPNFTFAFGAAGDKPVTGAWGASAASAVPAPAVTLPPCALTMSCTPGPNDWTGPVGGTQPAPPGAWTGPAVPPPPGWTGIGEPPPVGNPLNGTVPMTDPVSPAMNVPPVQPQQPWLPVLPQLVPPAPIAPPAILPWWQNPAYAGLVPQLPQANNAPSTATSLNGVTPSTNASSVQQPSSLPQPPAAPAPVAPIRLRPPSTGDAGLLAAFPERES
jgi:Tol biopolymer transport system component